MAASVIFLLLAALSGAWASSAPSDCQFETDKYLSCHLSSINSRLERTDFSVIPNQTVGLKVICSQQAEGRLTKGAFSSLSRLEELIIEDCVIRDLPHGVFHGLESLKKLELRTKSDVPLIIQAGAFDHLTKLETLDLSQNRLRHIPTGDLCRLEKLRSLNLSRNEIGSLEDLGLVSEDCLEELVTVDLSHNQVTELEEWVVESVEELNLESNYIRFIGEEVFRNSSLAVLKLSNNQISHLPAKTLSTLTLRELLLANNTLSSLSWNTFEGQFNLETLDLSGNILMSSGLPANLSQYLPNLLELNLCSNQLDNLSSEFTSFLANLQVIIGHIHRTLFGKFS